MYEFCKCLLTYFKSKYNMNDILMSKNVNIYFYRATNHNNADETSVSAIIVGVVLGLLILLTAVMFFIYVRRKRISEFFFKLISTITLFFSLHLNKQIMFSLKKIALNICH